MSQSALDKMVGMVIDGAYKLDAKLGVGGMGATFRAIQLKVDREVAIKILRPAVLEEASPQLADQMRQRFVREATITGKLKHPNTVQLLDFGTTDDGMMYLVLEFLDGPTLAHVMAESNGPMHPARVAHIGYQMCQSLSEAHNRGLIHRDLKPDNVMLVNYGGNPDHVKILDFGIARVIDPGEEDGPALTATGLAIGTPKYMAPEQVDARKLSAQSDLYSLGIVLYEMLMGEAPFSAASAMSLALKHVQEPPPPLDDRYGTDWMQLIEMLLAKKPERRPASAEDVAMSLQQLMTRGDEAALTIALPAPALTLGDNQPRRRTTPTPRLIGAIAIAGLALVVGLFIAISGDEEPSGDSPVASEAKPTATPVGAATTTDDLLDRVPEEVKEEVKEEAKGQPAPSPTPASAHGQAPVVPPVTTVSVLSTPTGVAVFRHGKQLCRTPCLDVRIDGIGETALELTHPDYKSLLLTVPLKPGTTIKREVVLDAAPKPPSPPPAADAAAPVPSKAVAKKKKAPRKKKSKKTKTKTFGVGR